MKSATGTGSTGAKSTTGTSKGTGTATGKTGTTTGKTGTTTGKGTGASTSTGKTAASSNKDARPKGGSEVRGKRSADGEPRPSSSSSSGPSASRSPVTADAKDVPRSAGSTNGSTWSTRTSSGNDTGQSPHSGPSRTTKNTQAATTHHGKVTAVDEPEEGLEFEWKEQPQVLRDLVKNLSVLASCVFEIHDAPMDGSVDEDKPFVRVLGMDAFNAAAVHLHYMPTDLVKYVPGRLLVKVELRRLKNWLLKKVLPNGYTATLRRYAHSPDFLHGVFQKGSIVRRRTLVLDRVEEGEVKESYVFNERWRIALPLQLFRCEMQAAVEAASHNAGRKGSGGSTGSQPRAKVSFELRRDPRTKATYFGILQDSMGEGNDLWLPAPMKEAVEGQPYVEFTVASDAVPGSKGDGSRDGGLSAALASFGGHADLADGLAGGHADLAGGAASDPMTVYKDMYKRDYRKMEPVFTNMVFSGAYLSKFVEHIDGADFVYLVLSPDMPNEDGEVKAHPGMLEHTAGSYAKFRFILARDDAQQDDEDVEPEAERKQDEECKATGDEQDDQEDQEQEQEEQDGDDM